MESNTEYFRAVNLQNAPDVAERHRPGIFVAGCTNVIPNIRANAISPKFLIDLSRINELAGIKEEGGEFRDRSPDGKCQRNETGRKRLH